MMLDISVLKKKEGGEKKEEEKKMAPREFKVWFWLVLDPCPVSLEHSDPPEGSKVSSSP